MNSIASGRALRQFWKTRSRVEAFLLLLTAVIAGEPIAPVAMTLKAICTFAYLLWIRPEVDRPHLSCAHVFISFTENLMKKILFSALVVAASGLTGVLQCAQADDDDDRSERGFSLRDLRGSYSVQLDGFVPSTTAGAPPTPVSILGRFTADGAGKARGSRTLIITGQPIPIPTTFDCDYTVNLQGTGTLACTITETNPNVTPPTPIKRIDTFNIVLDRRGAEVRLLLQNGLPAPGFPAIPGLTVIAGAPISGTAVRQH